MPLGTQWIAGQPSFLSHAVDLDRLQLSLFPTKLTSPAQFQVTLARAFTQTCTFRTNEATASFKVTALRIAFSHHRRYYSDPYR